MILRKTDVLAAAIALLILLAFGPGIAFASTPQTTATVPWEEFRALLNAEQSLKEKAPKKNTPVYTLHSVAYRLQPQLRSDKIGNGSLSGNVIINGRWIAGEPEPLALFSGQIAITDVVKLEGANLVATAKGYQLLAEPGPFSAELNIAIAANSSKNSSNRQEFGFQTPSALSTQLVILNMSTGKDKYHVSGENLLAIPQNSAKLGGATESGQRYAFTGQGPINLSIAEPSAPQPMNVDVISRLSITAGRLQQTVLLNSKSAQSNIELQFDPSFSWLSNSQQGRLVAPGQLLLARLQADQAVQLHFERNWRPADTGNNELQLPAIQNNRGEQQLFAVREPLTGHLAATGNNKLAIAPTRLKPLLGDSQSVQKSESNTLQLSFSAFQQVSQPALIVDHINYFASFADDGRHLATLQLSVPAGYGNRLAIPPVADAELWALSVNGQKKPLYKNTAGDWLVPLEVSQASAVELTWIQQLPRPGLHGALALKIPPLGIASRQLNVALSLAPRLQLLSLEGDLLATQQRWSIPANVQLNGNPRFFSVPFYRGQAVNARLHYQEPVTRTAGGREIRGNTTVHRPQRKSYAAPEFAAEPATANSRGWQIKP